MARARCRCVPSAGRVRVVPSAIRSAVAIVPSGPAIKPLRDNRAPTHVPTHVRIIVRIPDRQPVPIRGARFRIADTGRIVRAVDTIQTKETGATRPTVPAVLTPIRAEPIVRRFVLSRAPVVAPPDPDLRSGALDVLPRELRRVVILNPRRMLSPYRKPRRLRCNVLPGPRVRRSPGPFTTASSSASQRAIPPHLLRAHRVRSSVATMRNRII